MFIPLIHFGNDERPFFWWEWLFAPVILPVLLFSMFFISLLLFPVSFIHHLRIYMSEYKMRKCYTKKGRFIYNDDFIDKLLTGEGTIIIEHSSPYGPIREWWTMSDIISDAPIPLPTDIQYHNNDIIKTLTLADYASLCVNLYLNSCTGTGLLANSMTRLSFYSQYSILTIESTWNTAILLPLRQSLTGKYPNAKIVTIFYWMNPPSIFQGDIIDVINSESMKDLY